MGKVGTGECGMKHIKTPVVSKYGNLIDANNKVLFVPNDNLSLARLCALGEETATVINAHDTLVAVLREARAAIVFRMQHCDGTETPKDCNCDWCGDDGGLLVRIDAALAAAGEVTNKEGDE
jgi:hypothetical protein